MSVYYLSGLINCKGSLLCYNIETKEMAITWDGKQDVQFTIDATVPIFILKGLFRDPLIRSTLYTF